MLSDFTGSTPTPIQHASNPWKMSGQALRLTQDIFLREVYGCAIARTVEYVAVVPLNAHGDANHSSDQI